MPPMICEESVMALPPDGVVNTPLKLPSVLPDPIHKGAKNTKKARNGQ